MLTLAVSSCNICMVIYHNIPEVLCRCQIHLQIIFLLRRKLIIIFLIFCKYAVSLYSSRKFRNGSVRVFTAEHILAGCQLFKQRHFVKALSRRFNVIVSCNAVQFIESLIHTAVLNPEKLLLIRQICTTVVQIFAKCFRHFNGCIFHFCIIYVFRHINQAGNYFVQVVIRNKHCAVVRRRRCASVHSGEDALRERGDISRALGIQFSISVLTLFQSVYSILDLLHKLCLYIRIVLAQICLRKRRHIMSECMAAEVGRSGSLPAAVSFLCRRFKAGHIVELIQELLSVQAEQVFLLFCKRVDHVVVVQCNIIHKACVGQIQRLLRKHCDFKFLCHRFAVHKYSRRLQCDFCVRFADFRSGNHAGVVHSRALCYFPCDHRACVSGCRKRKIAACLRRNIQCVQVILCDLSFVNHSAVLLIQSHCLFRGSRIVKQFIMIQRSQQICAVVCRAVIAD